MPEDQSATSHFPESNVEECQEEHQVQTADPASERADEHAVPGVGECDEQVGRGKHNPSTWSAARRRSGEKKGLSQRQLAELVGTTQSAIARLEGGRISPSLPTLDRIANALDAELTVSLTDTQRLLGAR